MVEPKFVDDVTRLFLRSRLGGFECDVVLCVLKQHLGYRKVPFKLSAKGISEGGNLIAVSLIASGTEPGDEKILGILNEEFSRAFRADKLMILVSIVYKDVIES